MPQFMRNRAIQQCRENTCWAEPMIEEAIAPLDQTVNEFGDSFLLKCKSDEAAVVSDELTVCKFSHLFRGFLRNV